MRRSIFIITAALLTLTACTDFDDATEATTVGVQLVQPADFTTATSLSGKTITMTLNGQSTTATTDDGGLATFLNIVPDIYDISTSWTLTPDEYYAATGTTEQVTGATVSGSLNSQLIGSATTLTLETHASVNRDIVIGKVYHAGSKDNNNRNYIAGKYIELYNQSDDSVDVSGLYIGIVESESTPAYTLENLHDAYADSVVLLKQIYRIPATEPFIVAPGGTVLIVNSAIDHSVNDSLESDLREADFEVKDARGNYQNNPATPAMDIVYTTSAASTVMNLLQGGTVGVVIFRTGEDVTAWPTTYRYGRSSGTEWKLCPVRLITDGMEVLRNRSTGIDVSTKRLYSSIDAGYALISSLTGWTGEVVYRKTLRTENGHKILEDTNNSTNDFKAAKHIKPRQYDD